MAKKDPIVVVCGLEMPLSQLHAMQEADRLAAIRRMESGPQSPACKFISDALGTRRWVVAPRLTPSLVARGYALAVSNKRLDAIEAEWDALKASMPAVIAPRVVSP